MILLTLQTRLHHYAAPFDPGFQLRALHASQMLPTCDENGRPLVSAELAPLLDPHDTTMLARRHALQVPLRRRSALLLFDAAGYLDSEVAELPLPPLLAARLRNTWVRSVCIVANELMLVLNLRTIAQYIVVGAAAQPEDNL